MRACSTILLAWLVALAVAGESEPEPPEPILKPDAVQLWQIPPDDAKRQAAIEALVAKIVPGKTLAMIERYDIGEDELAVLEERAETGDAIALDIAFYVRFLGLTGRADWPTARRWLARGAEVGGPVSMLYLGRCFNNGYPLGDTLTATDESRKVGRELITYSRDVFKVLSDRKDPTAAFFYGVALASLGDGSDIQAHYRRNLQLGGTIARAPLAQLLLAKPGDLSRASEGRQLLEEAVAEGNLFAIRQLGQMKLTGTGYAKDLPGAVALLTRAAEAGNPDAMANLAASYQNGLDGKPDFAKSFEWNRKAALNGNANAQMFLGVMYHHGKGAPFSPAEAIRWLSLAVARGLPDAEGMFGFALLRMQQNPKNLIDPLPYLLKAAESGSDFMDHNVLDYYLGMTNTSKLDMNQAVDFALKHLVRHPGCIRAFLALGMAYCSGQGGIEQDVPTGLKYLNYAADHGSCRANVILGGFSWSGFYLDQDYAKARQYFQRCTGCACPGARQGHFWLARCCHEGLGGPKDPGMATKYMWDLARHGMPDANAYLAKMIKEGGAPEVDRQDPEYWLRRGERSSSRYAVFLRARWADTGEEGVDVKKVVNGYVSAWEKGCQEADITTRLTALKGQVTDTNLLAKVDGILAGKTREEVKEAGDAAKAKERLERAQQHIEKAKSVPKDQQMGVDHF